MTNEGRMYDKVVRTKLLSNRGDRGKPLKFAEVAQIRENFANTAMTGKNTAVIIISIIISK